MPDSVAEWLGVLGFLVALFAVAWQIWTYFDARRPKIGAEAVFSEEVGRKYGTLSLDVWNAGRVPVYITDVFLACDIEPRADKAGGIEAYEVGRGTALVCRCAPDDPLGPGQGRKYELPDSAACVCKDLAKRPADCVSVRIMAPGKELLRLPGAQVHWIVEDIARTVEGYKPREKKQGDVKATDSSDQEE